MLLGLGRCKVIEKPKNLIRGHVDKTHWDRTLKRVLAKLNKVELDTDIDCVVTAIVDSHRHRVFSAILNAAREDVTISGNAEYALWAGNEFTPEKKGD